MRRIQVVGSSVVKIAFGEEFIMGQFFCVGLGSKFYVLCLDSCLQTYVIRKIKTARFMLCLTYNITWNETGICSFGAVWAVRAVGKNQVLTFASLVC